MTDAPVTDIAVERKKRKSKSVPATQDEVPAETKDQRGQLIFTNLDPQNTTKILGTLANMRDLLNYYKIICRYNVISKQIIHIIPGEEFSSENEEEASLACIFSYMKEWKLPVDGHKLYLTRIADEQQYNPVLDWIKSKPWDGISRIPDFCATIESPEEEAKNLLIRRWLLTAAALASRNGVDSAGCLVLQGPQDLGKTWWVRKLVPESVRDQFIRTDATVDPHDRDSVSQVIRYWIVELGEIGATFVKSELQALKSFITRQSDVIRRPYGIGDKSYPRRTALIASVDQRIFLHDTAGNRRFWTIPCTAIDSYHNINMQQLWAEILHMLENGESWQLAPDEKEHIKRINQEHMQIDPIYEKIIEKYDFTKALSDKATATQIAERIGIKNVTQRETRLIADYVLKLNGNQRETGNLKRLLIPYTFDESNWGGTRFKE